MTSVLLLDNRDSFVHILEQYLRELGATTTMIPSHELSSDGVRALLPDTDAILVSPGPGRPEDAGVSLAAVGIALETGTPLLGVCLGHQAIAQHLGARVTYAAELMHGTTSTIEHDGRGVFADSPGPFLATRYHSLVVDPDTVPAELEVTARTPDGTIMGIRHRTSPVEGVQFHPESILTEHGPDLLRAWLRSVEERGLSRRSTPG